jgi:hypothetical protein
MPRHMQLARGVTFSSVRHSEQVQPSLLVLAAITMIEDD